MATAIGQRYLVRYYEADEQGRTDLLPMLQTCLTRHYITQAEYDRAIAGEPPVGYVPTPTFVAADQAADTTTN